LTYHHVGKDFGVYSPLDIVFIKGKHILIAVGGVAWREIQRASALMKPRKQA
jgi:hypothetical protein